MLKNTTSLLSRNYVNRDGGGLRSVAGLVIQATGRTDFEDGSRTATTLEVSNGLHSVRTSPEVSMAGPN